jgi:PAS domain S-box-containing protein
MRKRVSLQRLITLSVLSLGLLSGTIGIAYAYWQAKQSLRTTIGVTFQELAHQSADKTALILAKEIEWVERLSALPEVRGAVKKGVRLALDTPELQQWREEQRQYFRSLVILDRHGRLLGGITSETTRMHYTKHRWWSVVFEKKRPWAGDLLLDDSGHLYWEVAAPIMDEHGAVLGALKVVIGRAELFASVLRSRIGQTGHVMLVGENGVVLACPVLPPARHSKSGILLSSRDRSGQALLRSALWTEVENDTHGSQGVIVGISPVVLPIHIVQEGAWYILVRQDPGETYAPLRLLMYELAAFWIAAVALVVWLRWRLARRIIQPVNALVQHMRLLGQTEHRTPRAEAVSTGIVEIDTLATGLDDLAERLEQSWRECRRYVQELEQANREIVVSEEHYRMLWNHSVDAKLIVGSDGTVQDMNRRGETKLGRSVEELVGKPASGLFVESDRAGFHEAFQDVITSGKEKSAGELHVPAPAGATMTMEVGMVPVEKAGAVSAVLLQLNDVTEQKQLHQQLLRSERLASLSQFASMFAHDIRNPLAGIKKTLELLAQRKELQAEPLGRWCDDLRFTTDLLLGMINDMLDVHQESYSGLPLITSRFSLNAALREVVQLFCSEAEVRGVSFRVEMPDEEVMVSADRRRLQRVGINLIHNALKFSPPQGVIAVTVQMEREGALRSQLGHTETPIVLIRVADEGPGIESQELPHLFEMLFRKKDGSDLRIGRGLGLYFCRLVVEAHHGHIWVVNRPSGGAMFTVALPVSQESLCRSSL